MALRKLSITEEVFPSDANFLLVRVKEASRNLPVSDEHGYYCPDRSKVSLCYNCLRITVGTPEENERLINALRKL